MSNTWTHQRHIIPVAVGEVNNKQIALYEEQESEASNTLNQEPTKSFLQRAATFVLRFGIFGALFALLAPTLFFGFISWLTIKLLKLKNAYETSHTALTETVTALKKSQAIERDQKLKNELESEQSKESKKIIAALKAAI